MNATMVVCIVYMYRNFFVITEIVHMNGGVSSEKEKVNESHNRSVTPLLDTHFGCWVGGISSSP